jgi:hypothetical protein
MKRQMYLLFVMSFLASWPVFGQTRTLKICVDGNASPELKQAAERIRQSVAQSSLLTILAAGGVSIVDSNKLVREAVEARSYHHLILVGLPTDPMIRAAWQHEASMEDGGIYVFGFGHLRGTLGYAESDRNVFLHSAAIAAAPYETEVITLTGTSVAGVRLAVDAFLEAGLVNGVVAAPGWTRVRAGLLDRDPLTGRIDWPALAPTKLEAALAAGIRIAQTQAGETEYRDLLATTGLIANSICRVKYYIPGAWDGSAPLEAAAPGAYLDGLHRRAYGNTLWIAQFSSQADALSVAARIGKSAHMTKQDDGTWLGSQPTGDFAAEPKDSLRTHSLRLWTVGSAVLMSTLAVSPVPADQIQPGSAGTAR